MFIGEGPGSEEDKVGKPFVGPAGQELQSILGEMDFAMEEIYVTNLVRHRPPGNRAPSWEDEVTVCSKFFLEEISVLAPKVIVCLGRQPAEALMRLAGIKPPRTTIRGTSFDFHGTPVMCTWHPSYVIRNGKSSDPTSQAYKLRGEMVVDIRSAIATYDTQLPAARSSLAQP